MNNSYIGCGKTTAGVSRLGGTVTALAVEGKDIFYPLRETEGKARGGCPICAPWFGSSPRGPKKHGYLRDSKAEYVIQRPNAVELGFLHPGDDGYPWSLRYEVGISVRDNELAMRLQMERVDDGIAGRAPVLPAFHPYFACQDAGRVLVHMGGETHSGFSEKARAVPLAGDILLIEMPEGRISMQLGGAFSAPESRIVLWSDAPDKYACIEPVLGDKALFDSPGGRSLGVGEHIEVSMSILVF